MLKICAAKNGVNGVPSRGPSVRRPGSQTPIGSISTNNKFLGLPFEIELEKNSNTCPEKRQLMSMGGPSGGSSMHGGDSESFFLPPS